MDIKQLTFLRALDETRHFGHHDTQPTLPMRLRSLEEELGLELVRRGLRFEDFTEAGERVLAWARPMTGCTPKRPPVVANWSAPCTWAASTSTARQKARKP